LCDNKGATLVVAKCK